MSKWSCAVPSLTGSRNSCAARLELCYEAVPGSYTIDVAENLMNGEGPE